MTYLLRKLFICCVLVSESGFILGLRHHTLQFKNDANISSLGYPDSYHSNTVQQWAFNQSYGRWLLTFTSFHLEMSLGCKKDNLTIYDGNQPLVYCNKQTIQPYLSRHSAVKIVFQSDDSIEAEGFHMQISHFVDEDEYRRMVELRLRNAKVLQIPPLTMKQELVTGLTIGLGFAIFVFLLVAVYLIYGLNKKPQRLPKDRFMDIRPLSVSFTNNKERRYLRSSSNDTNVTDVPPSPADDKRPPFLNQANKYV